jgi:predicted AlkP superfamily phosphohydrolase/phosphomutase
LRPDLSGEKMATAIIGLDGADWKIMEPLLSAGKLPAIKRLVDGGRHGILQSTIPPSSPPAWASMITGVNPGKHGVFDFTIIDENYRKMPLQMMSKLGVAPLWRILNAHSITTGVVNLPILYPAEPVDGFMVCGMVTPGNARVFTHPEHLSRSIGNPKENWIIGEGLAAGHNLEDFFLEIRYKTRRQAEFVMEMLKEYKTSFLMVVFDGTDKMQHYFWKFWDPTHPRYDPQASEVLRCAIDTYYIDLDTHIGRIIDRLGESDIFVVSDHGFMNMSHDFFIEKWLLEEGYLYRTRPIVKASSSVIRKMVSEIWRSAALQKLKDLAKQHEVLHRWGQQVKATTNSTNAARNDIDWFRTRAYFAGVSSQSIRINLKGREKYGIVCEGEEYTRLVTELKSRLKQCRDPISGSPVISEVYHRDEIFHGPRVMDAPDLIIISEKGYSLQEGFPEHFLGRSIQYGLDRSGAHRSEGIFIASGPNLSAGAAPLEAQIVDIMPTILYLNGLAIPDYVDGNVLTDIIREEYLQQHPVEWTNQFPAVHAGTDEMTDEERELLKEHLKALGYF